MFIISLVNLLILSLVSFMVLHDYDFLQYHGNIIINIIVVAVTLFLAYKLFIKN